MRNCIKISVIITFVASFLVTNLNQLPSLPSMADSSRFTMLSSEPMLIPSVIPSPTPIPLTNTLKIMKDYDYVSNSVTGISKKKVPVSTLQKNVNKYGTLYGKGMPFQEYKEAMDYQWIDCTMYDKIPGNIKIDLTRTMNYKSYKSYLEWLSRYDGVYLYKIGESAEGRDLFAIEIDVESKHKKNVIMLTGSIHAREFAGGTYLMKQLVDIVQKAQIDKTTMELLKRNKFVAVPIINVDGREALIYEPHKWTTKQGELWKSYLDGTDGNRNYPSLLWGQLSKGNKLKWNISLKPSHANYAGEYAGSNLETKAMMKWIYHYVAVEQASCFIDLHQQGRVIYAGKGWSTKAQEKRSTDLRKSIFALINKGNSRNEYKVYRDEPKYGLDGSGSSLTDYAMSIAVGAKFSPAFGFYAFTDGKKEHILMEIVDLDNMNFKVKETNNKLATITFEIGLGSNYFGDSLKARKLNAEEYEKYHFDQLLEALPGMLK